MNLIAAVDLNWAIGRGGDQLCYIPADLKRFQALTTGHPVILGRKTLATFPGGRPLKNRRNLILSRDPSFAPEGAEVFRSLEALRAAAPAALLDWRDTAYIPKRGRAWEGADAFFPDLDAGPDWEMAEEGEPQEHAGIPFRYVTYRRRKPHVCG